MCLQFGSVQASRPKRRIYLTRFLQSRTCQGVLSHESHFAISVQRRGLLCSIAVMEAAAQCVALVLIEMGLSFSGIVFNLLIVATLRQEASEELTRRLLSCKSVVRTQFFESTSTKPGEKIRANPRKKLTNKFLQLYWTATAILGKDKEGPRGQG